MSASYPKTRRLLNQRAYSAVFDSHPTKFNNASGTVLAIRATSAESRLGIIVAKKNVRLASQRNRVKRVVREYFRQNPLGCALDLVFLARRGVADKTNAELNKDLTALWRQLRARC